MHYNFLTLCVVLIAIQLEVPILKKKVGENTHTSMQLQIHVSKGLTIF